MPRKIDWWQPQTGTAEEELVREVLASNYLNEGAITRRFEEELARLLQVKHCITATSGTAALFLSMKAIGIGPGDEVVVPDLTFIATANAAEMCGARPVLVDVDGGTLNMSVDALEKALTSRTKAIVPVHVSGRGADMEAIQELADSRGIAVIEDAAEAFMSRKGNKWLGTHAVMGCFSLSPNKTITTGQGGFIVTDDDDLAGRLAQFKDQGRPSRGTGGDDLHPAVGYNFKFTNVQAAIGLGQLQSLGDRLERMQSTYRHYCRRLKGAPGIELLPFDVDNGESPQWVDALVDDRQGLCQLFDQKEIGYRRFWHPLHRQKPYLADDERYPNACSAGQRALWLPSALQLTEDDVEFVCQTILSFVSQKAAI